VKSLDIDEQVGAIVESASSVSQRRATAKAITLFESTRADHRAQADALLTALLPYTGQALRLGISGVPGVGKSTFIEALGLYLIAHNHRVAVLAVDPSSSVSGGSILGDKTRMERLAASEQAYIRPSPASGTLGGVAERTREAMLVCEAAGYDVVIVETVGVGQSEIAVAGMTDMFVLLQLPNAGDDLQAIKKGVMELADLIVINKADLDAAAATRARAQIISALGLSLRLFGQEDGQEKEKHRGHGQSEHAAMGVAERGWQPQVLQLSALTATGIDTFWAAVQEFKNVQTANGKLAQRREKQALAWMWERIESGLKQSFQQNTKVQALLPRLSRQVAEGTLPASVAARTLLTASTSASLGATTDTI
jgi:LAO/AO transport system kinase